MDEEVIASWPGKSFPEGAEHPALWHMMDVAACASRLIDIQGLTGREKWDNAAVLLVALHDLGKFSLSFRNALRHGSLQTLYHWEHSYRLLQKLDEILRERLGGEASVRRELVHAICGHHGGPVRSRHRSERRRQDAQIGDAGFYAAKKALEVVLKLPVVASLEGMTADEARILSWQLSGLTIQSDWLGSNPEWFGPAPAGISVSDYWRMVLDRAAVIVRAAGLVGSSVRPGGANRVLPKARNRRPIQQAVANVAISDGPNLFLIEDATGAGKTEAAIMLAARLLELGRAKGLFFALPTMATSNAMLPRLEAVSGALFEGRPSLALSHGRARQNARFQTIRGRRGTAAEGQPSCGDWLADDRRRVLLADIAVGTIDQALLGVLPTRFSSLRLAALSRRVLIVDEAHSYDPYMEAELSRLLEFQATLGGSAIVMTATLPLQMRDRLVAAFQRGRGAEATPVAEWDYPCLTSVGHGVSIHPVEPARETIRKLPVRFISSSSESIEILVKAKAAGAACVWIRNAVDDAVAAVQDLRARGVEADLLHARFAVCDRLEKEARQVARFGREGSDRAGRVLVATQVVEQSLDLDFDVMVSDLAPIGSLIQRAGRLWRHMDRRPSADRPVPGPEVHVLTPHPDRVTSAGWLHTVLDRGAHVYPHDIQWRTAKVLFDFGTIDAPHGLRDLIEAVHGPDPLPVPEALERAEQERLGGALREGQQARMYMALATQPFAQQQLEEVWSDERFPTRLGEDQTTLRLARRDKDGIVPWAEDWSASEVQMSARAINRLGGIPQEDPEIEHAKRNWPKWAREAILLAVVGEDGMITEGLRYSPETGLIRSVPARE